MIVHTFQELWGYRVTGSRSDNRIHRAPRANGGLVIIDPFGYVCGRKNGTAIEASAKTASVQLASVHRAVLVSDDEVLLHVPTVA